MERVFSRPVTTAGELIEGNPAGTVIGGQWQRPEPVLAEKLTLESKELTLSVGQTGSVEATLTPEPTLEPGSTTRAQTAVVLMRLAK